MNNNNYYSNATLRQWWDLWDTSRFSRMPVYKERIDNIVGLCYSSDILELLARKTLELSTGSSRSSSKDSTGNASSIIANTVTDRDYNIFQESNAIDDNYQNNTDPFLSDDNNVSNTDSDDKYENNIEDDVSRRTVATVVRTESSFFVPESMSLWAMLREFRVIKVSLRVNFVCNSSLL